MTAQPPSFHQHGGAPSVLPPAPQPPAPYDLVTPGEPEAYRVPPAYRRPYGEVTRDKRGRGYNTAFMGLMCAAVSYLAVFLAGSLALIALIPAVTAIVLGVKALLQKKNAPQTLFAGRITGMSWGAIAAGALCIPVTVAMLLINSWFMSTAEQINCEAIYRGNDAAIADCIAQNSWD